MVRRLLMSMRCWLLVTAGWSPTAATFFLTKAFINVDLPTLGMPMIMRRSGLTASLRCGASFCARDGILATSPAFLQEMATALTPGWASKWASQALVASGSARSALLRIFRQGRCRKARSSWIIGLLEAWGRRASSTSTTTSATASVSAAFLRADVMCPGNHWMDMRFPCLAAGDGREEGDFIAVLDRCVELGHVLIDGAAQVFGGSQRGTPLPDQPVAQGTHGGDTGRQG